ncbi:MAG: hypothetical protein MRERV_1c011 [Mycoplasmataceae bacterium RV_VA103A]|nr:MAG: hypothetical protein MRERV_1c011 [Mycoplasmataceae bacterium RV_VA103A]
MQNLRWTLIIFYFSPTYFRMVITILIVWIKSFIAKICLTSINMSGAITSWSGDWIVTPIIPTAVILTVSPLNSISFTTASTRILMGLTISIRKNFVFTTLISTTVTFILAAISLLAEMSTITRAIASPFFTSQLYSCLIHHIFSAKTTSSNSRHNFINLLNLFLYRVIVILLYIVIL